MKKLTVLFTFTAFIWSCHKAEEADLSKYTCGTTPVTYEKDVKAILNKSCAIDGCHSSKNPSEGIDLSSYAQAKIHSAHAPFMGSMEHLSGYEAMPKGGAKLSEAQLTTIACWIKGGALEK